MLTNGQGQPHAHSGCTKLLQKACYWTGGHNITRWRPFSIKSWIRFPTRETRTGQ